MSVKLSQDSFQWVFLDLDIFKEYSVRREQLSQAPNCSCSSELNTGAFTIKLIVNAQVFSSDVQLQFSA